MQDEITTQRVSANDNIMGNHDEILHVEDFNLHNVNPPTTTSASNKIIKKRQGGISRVALIVVSFLLLLVGSLGYFKYFSGEVPTSKIGEDNIFGDDQSDSEACERFCEKIAVDGVIGNDDSGTKNRDVQDALTHGILEEDKESFLQTEREDNVRKKLCFCTNATWERYRNISARNNVQNKNLVKTLALTDDNLVQALVLENLPRNFDTWISNNRNEHHKVPENDKDKTYWDRIWSFFSEQEMKPIVVDKKPRLSLDLADIKPPSTDSNEHRGAGAPSTDSNEHKGVGAFGAVYLKDLTVHNFKAGRDPVSVETAVKLFKLKKDVKLSYTKERDMAKKITKIIGDNPNTYLVKLYGSVHPDNNKATPPNVSFSSNQSDFLPNHALCYEVAEGAELMPEGNKFLSTRNTLTQNSNLNFSDLLPKILTRLILPLGRLHHNNVYHRDVKSSNIMINPSAGTVDGIADSVRLIDYGLAEKVTSPSQRVILAGTAVYMSTELVTRRVSQYVLSSADFYALAVVMFEFSCGMLIHRPININKHPLSNEDFLAHIWSLDKVSSMRNYVEDQYSELMNGRCPGGSKNANIPENIEELLKKMISINAHGRATNLENLAQWRTFMTFNGIVKFMCEKKLWDDTADPKNKCTDMNNGTYEFNL